ncbi:MAG: efflux RND transporter periplasmic adaptor subunit [Planctomycetia bacterium]|nr:efflux RND transporter periplasmic adaptor subunit [Planctomycetia bacterium]
MRFCISDRKFNSLAGTALFMLVTAAVTWLWAHEGHAPLPTKGAQVDLEKGLVVLSKEARDALAVQTAEVQLRNVEDIVLAYATLVAPWQQHAFVSTRLPGRIAKLHVQPGQSVAAGQVLAEVEALELKNLQLELITAQNDIELSKKILQELEKAPGAISGQRIFDAQAKHRQDKNALDVARSKWLSLGLSQDDLDQLLRDRDHQRARTLPVHSPIDGVVIHADQIVGKVVDPTEHLFEVVDLSTVWVKIGVLEQDLHRVAIGQPVELTLAAYPGEVFHDQVQVKGLYLDPQTHVGTIWAELTNPPGQEPRFLPGMHGQAHVARVSPKKMPAAPRSAVIRDGAERYVLVEQSATPAASEYLKKNVVVGGQSDEFVVIQGNVFPGDRVVTRGSHELATFFVQGVLKLSPEAAKSIGLRVEPARLHVVEDVVAVDGTIDVPPDRRTFASSQLAGNLHKIHVGRGQQVQAGDVLAEVASLELQNLQLDLLRAHLEAGVLGETYERLQAARGALPDRQFWETESAYKAAVNRRESLRQKLLTVGLSKEQIDGLLAKKLLVDSLPLRAPINGAVVHFDKVLGQAIKAEEPLFEIQDLSRVWVQVYLSEREVPLVRLGMPARVRLAADPNFLGAGKVVRSSRIVGAENRTLAVWVELDAPAKTDLQHNMLARLSLTQRKPAPALAVPLSALFTDGTRSYLFVQRPDGIFDRRLVDTGRTDDRFVEIVSGLVIGEPVAIAGVAELQTAYAGIR